MFSMNIEVEPENGEELKGSDSPPTPNPNAELFDALTNWWVRYAAEPYIRLNSSEKLYPITIPWIFLETETSFEVAFDLSLLENLLEIYTAYGWGALEKIERTLKPLPELKKNTRKFFDITLKVVAVMVAQELVELEQQMLTYARKKWTTARKQLLEYLDAFKIVTINLEHYIIADRKLANEVLGLCRDYGIVAREVSNLQEKIAERNRKTPPKSRIRGSGADLWFEVYAAPHREGLNKMADYLKSIKKKFPAAVLVLSALPDSVISADTSYDKSVAASELENEIGSALKSLLADLQILEESLSSPAATLEVAELLKPLIANPNDFSALERLKNPSEGFEKKVLDIVFKRTEEKDQRLLANLDLVYDFFCDPAGVNPGTWTQVVLFQYCIRLTAVVEEKKQNKEFWEKFWGWIGRVTAFLSLIALMAIFPFGDAPVAPILASLLSLAGSLSTALVILTMTYDFVGRLQLENQLEADTRDKLFRLGQTDPEAIREIGEFLSHRRPWLEDFIKESFLLIISMGAAHTLKAVDVALNFHGFFQDINTLFASGEEESAPGEEDD
jgi:hypothetical protein